MRTFLFLVFGCMCVPSQAFTQGSYVVTITYPESKAIVVGTTPVRASVSVSGSPAGDGALIQGVQFMVDGIDLGAEDTSAPYETSWDTMTAADGLHTLRAVARDALGIEYTSDVVCVTVANGDAAETRFEETDVATAYTAGWIHLVGDRPFSGGTAAYSPKTDGRATFSFVGTSVKWIGFRGPQTGIALVFLDGYLVAQVDTYSPTEELEAVLYSGDGLEHRSHRLWIEVTGQKNPSSTDSIVVVDAFDVAPPSPPPTFTSGRRSEETGSAVSYSDGWIAGDTTTAWSGGTAATSTTAGARVTFAFTGTSVNWIGARGPSAGIARVFVDGTFSGEIDLYEPTRLQATVFSASGLDDAEHTLVIEATGLRNAASTDALVVVDAFDTRSRLEETRSAITYADYWEVTASRAWSALTAVYTWVAGAQATFTFTGSSVRWIGYRGPFGGIARVFLDGVFVAQIDTYAADEVVQGVTFEASGLTSGSHTLTIVATGEMHPLSQKPFVAVDAFDINF